MLSSAGASRLRMLLAVLAGTLVLVIAVVAVVLVIGAVTAPSAAGEGGDRAGSTSWRHDEAPHHQPAG